MDRKSRTKVVVTLDSMLRTAVAGASRPARWLALATVGVLLVAAWTAVWLSGGTRTAAPHAFYIPIVLAALPWGIRGATVTAAAATFLAGPLMPLDVAQGLAQPVANWAVRGGFFVIVGVLAGATVTAVRHSIESGLVTRLQEELHTSPHRTSASEDPDWHDRVRRVLAGESLQVIFQPVYALDDGRLIAVEALARFTDPGPSHPPDVWFAQAARYDLHVALELAAIELAIDTVNDPVVDLDPAVALQVNASPDTLPDPALAALARQLGPRPLTVELTEHIVIDDYPRLQASMNQLRARGIRIAVDDVGAGFASLQHIVRLAPDIIKLDISLTQGLRHDPIRRALATALTQFARQADITLIAEGIEDPADLTSWQQLGAHAAQGYLLGRPGPLPPASVATSIASSQTAPQRHRDHLVSRG